MSQHITTDSAERKDIPISSGFLNYFPLAVAEVARLSKKGNDKHNPGEPLHWAKEKSNDHADCLARHLLEHDKMDDDGFKHDVKVAWRAMALLQTRLESESADLKPVDTPTEPPRAAGEYRFEMSLKEQARQYSGLLDFVAQGESLWIPKQVIELESFKTAGVFAFHEDGDFIKVTRLDK